MHGSKVFASVPTMDQGGLVIQLIKLFTCNNNLIPTFNCIT